MALDRDAERILEMVRLSGRPPYETFSLPKHAISQPQRDARTGLAGVRSASRNPKR